MSRLSASYILRRLKIFEGALKPLTSVHFPPTWVSPLHQLPPILPWLLYYLCCIIHALSYIIHMPVILHARGSVCFALAGV